jgi:diacylglycerol O-acyltransferase / wax synthase
LLRDGSSDTTSSRCRASFSAVANISAETDSSLANQRLTDTPSELIRRGDSSVKLIGRTMRNPGAVAGDALRFGRSLRRVLTPPPAERSPLLRGGSGFGYRFVLHDVPLSELKAAERRPAAR